MLFLLTALLFAGCGKSGGYAPGIAASSSSSCAGQSVGGHCWYLGAAAESCSTVCASHGGYNSATRSYAGASGSTANCEAVLTALNAPGSTVTSDNTCPVALECVYSVATMLRIQCTNGAESAAASNAAGVRACACNS